MKRYRAWCLEEQDARETLARIERGELGLTILLWVLLMKGAGDPLLVAIWMKLLLLEPSSQPRAEIAGVALIFAHWRGLQQIWGPSLEGLDVEQIELVRRWKDAARGEGHREGLKEGIQEGHREALRQAVRIRFDVELPSDLNEALRQIKDKSMLDRWFKLSLESATFADFRAAIMPPKPNGTPKPNPPGDLTSQSP